MYLIFISFYCNLSTGNQMIPVKNLLHLMSFVKRPLFLTLVRVNNDLYGSPDPLGKGIEGFHHLCKGK